MHWTFCKSFSGYTHWLIFFHPKIWQTWHEKSWKKLWWNHSCTKLGFTPPVWTMPPPTGSMHSTYRSRRTTGTPNDHNAAEEGEYCRPRSPHRLIWRGRGSTWHIYDRASLRSSRSRAPRRPSHVSPGHTCFGRQGRTWCRQLVLNTRTKRRHGLEMKERRWLQKKTMCLVKCRTCKEMGLINFGPCTWSVRWLHAIHQHITNPAFFVLVLPVKRIWPRTKCHVHAHDTGLLVARPPYPHTRIYSYIVNSPSTIWHFLCRLHN
jgi:hypothetical protein